MADLREQRIYVKFRFKLGKAASEVHKKAVGDKTVERTQFLSSFLY